jgi:hypothetical protein
MSATLRVSDFVENRKLFPVPPPVINVAARQHPVTIHFSRRTSPDYLAEVVEKASRIHTRLPAGGILIFLTGQNEIAGVCRRLEERYGRRAIRKRNDQRDKQTAAFTQHTSRDDEIEAIINPTKGAYQNELTSLLIFTDLALKLTWSQRTLTLVWKIEPNMMSFQMKALVVELRMIWRARWVKGPLKKWSWRKN